MTLDVYNTRDNRTNKNERWQMTNRHPTHLRNNDSYSIIVIHITA